jgi:hypothetical protein
MHFTANRATPGARGTVCRHKLGVWPQFVEIFGDGERVPDLDPVMAEAGDKKGRRKEKEFGAGRGIVARYLLLLELETGHFAEKPAAQRPGPVILAGYGERGHAAVPRFGGCLTNYLAAQNQMH